MKNADTFNLYVAYPPMPDKASRWQRFKMNCYYSIQVSTDCPDTIEYFKSEVAILSEKQRQYNSFRYTIHPLSKFNSIYQVWSFFFYGILIYFKAFDFGFIYIAQYKYGKNHWTVVVLSVLDILALINTSLQFCIGYCNSSTRKIELSIRKIRNRYLYSGHFVCDVLSSIPRILTYQASTTVQLMMVSFILLKLRRISTFFKLIHPTVRVCGIKSSKTKKFICAFFIVISLVMHLMTCFHVGVPQYRITLTNHFENSWIDAAFMQHRIYRQYMATFFKCSQYTLLIYVEDVTENRNTEEVILHIVNYIIGKVLKITTSIVLLYLFVSQRMLRVKFEEIMTELKEYMMAKNLSDDLKNRLIIYYKYKYQGLFFNETLAKSVLSENLKREINVFLCKSLIKQVKLFKDAPPRVLKQFISYLVPQVYLPNDIIFQAGAMGDCMYFIESGTIALYTPSGKEICHLQDGNYFGESCLLFEDARRPASAKAVEITRIYILKKHHFLICCKTDDKIYQTLMKGVGRRLGICKEQDESYKSEMLEATQVFALAAYGNNNQNNE